VVKITDRSGKVVEQYEYSDYGQAIIRDPTGRQVNRSAISNPYLFTSQRYDPETGFYYYLNRYLDPAVGRFTTRDPIGVWGDLDNLGNGYCYVGNSPATFIDPMGLKPPADPKDLRYVCYDWGCEQLDPNHDYTKVEKADKFWRLKDLLRSFSIRSTVPRTSPWILGTSSSS
jgi:RHS repeat-associated protein